MRKYLITGGAFVLLTVFRYPINILWVKILNSAANSASQLPTEMSLFSVISSKIVIDLFVFTALAVYYGGKRKEKFIKDNPDPLKYTDKYLSLHLIISKWKEDRNASVFVAALPYILCAITIVIIDSVTLTSIFELTLNK